MLARPSPALRQAAEPLAVAQVRVQDRQRRLEPCAKPSDELRRERDLGHEHERLLVALDDRRDGSQVNLGLAAAGHAIEQVRCEAAECVADPLHGLLLCIVQRRTAARRGRNRLTSRHPLRLHDVAPRFQFAQRLRCALGCALQIGRRHFSASRQHFDDRAQAYRARLELRERFTPAQLGERPHDGFFAQGRAEAQGCRHGSGDDLADRMAVVIRRPQQQLQESSVEGRLLVDRSDDGAQLGGGHVGAVAAPDDHADHAPAPERHPHPLARNEIRLLGRRPVVERPPQRGVDCDREDHAASHSMHKTCGQACAWVGVNRTKCAAGRQISALVIICTRKGSPPPSTCAALGR